MIQLTNDLWLKADDCCYIVGEARQRVGRPLGLRNPTYYSTVAQAVEGALKRAMRKGVKDNKITTLQQFIQEQERLHGELEALLAPLEGGKPWQSVVEAKVTAKTGKDISQPSDGGKEA